MKGAYKLAKFVINGGNTLEGEVKINGAKNAALPILAAALLADSPSILKDIPDLRDVSNLCEIIKGMGARVERSGLTVEIDPKSLDKTETDKELAKKQIANNIYKVARENYKKELGFDLQLNPKERELYANELYEGINEQSDEERKKLYSNKNVNKNSGSVTTVKPHNRKGTKGVRGHYRKTKSSDLI